MSAHSESGQLLMEREEEWCRSGGGGEEGRGGGEEGKGGEEGGRHVCTVCVLVDVHGHTAGLITVRCALHTVTSPGA